MAALIRSSAAAQGFVACGFAPADAAPRLRERLQAWLAAGMHGDMLWMEQRADQRADPATLWPEVRSVIMLGMAYTPGHDPLALADVADRARISVYAQGADYHDIVKRALKAIARDMVAAAPEAPLKVFVDTAPVMEKPLAAAAGLGWQGKHSNLVSRRDGSWLFLGAIYTTLDLPADTPAQDRCGSCSACHDACPTAAFAGPYRVDARRCISYLTIELQGAIPEEFRPLIGNRIYGCDDCQLCCPWNRFARLGDPEFAPRHQLNEARLVDLFAWSEASFNERLAGSPIRRIGHVRWLRNIAVALGNAPASASVSEALASRADHPSALVREHVTWALASQAITSSGRAPRA